MPFSFIKGFILVLLSSLIFTASGFAQSLRAPLAADVHKLIAELYTHPWPGAGLTGESPTVWDFAFTEPMKRILEVGAPAQDALLEKISDPRIKDQVIILLGGVGDERAVVPIIQAMEAHNHESYARRINTAANLALTNITVADTIWHHGGGVVIERCPDNPKSCWQKWLEKEGKSFSVKTIKQSRRYSNYPNYGIYKQP